MPITQLMQKLSGRLDTRRSEAPQALEPRRSGAQPMECSTSFEVVAEVLPLSPGHSPAGSMCSASSSSGSDAGGQQLHQHNIPTDGHGRTSSSAALLASSLSGPLPSLVSAGSRPATERALRARGKALLRSEDGLSAMAISCSPGQLDLQHQLSLESSSSMLDATMLHSLPSGSGLPVPHVASPRYVRSSTAPLPGSLRAVSSAALDQQAAPGTSKGLPARPALPESDEEEEEDGLIHPISPAAAAGAGDAHQEAQHCHWEDGVIASWLQGIDHSELLHDGGDDDEEQQDQDMPRPAAAAEASCSKAAAAAAGPSHRSHSVPNAVLYSSLLYK